MTILADTDSELEQFVKSAFKAAGVRYLVAYTPEQVDRIWSSPETRPTKIVSLDSSWVFLVVTARSDGIGTMEVRWAPYQGEVLADVFSRLRTCLSIETRLSNWSRGGPERAQESRTGSFSDCKGSGL